MCIIDKVLNIIAICRQGTWVPCLLLRRKRMLRFAEGVFKIEGQG
ncbi:hypothetical protein CLOL250_02812 [Clostridium sp. L2-50]|nr:hypothetical protein CLOL250_02812 [Clostridium sp. L2-50]